MRKEDNPVARFIYALSGVMYAFGMWAAFSEGYYFFAGFMFAGVLWVANMHDKVSVVKKK